MEYKVFAVRYIKRMRRIDQVRSIYDLTIFLTRMFCSFTLFTCYNSGLQVWWVKHQAKCMCTGTTRWRNSMKYVSTLVCAHNTICSSRIWRCRNTSCFSLWWGYITAEYCSSLRFCDFHKKKRFINSFVSQNSISSEMFWIFLISLSFKFEDQCYLWGYQLTN